MTLVATIGLFGPLFSAEAETEEVDEIAEDLRESYRKERNALEERYREEAAALRDSYLRKAEDLRERGIADGIESRKFRRWYLRLKGQPLTLTLDPPGEAPIETPWLSALPPTKETRRHLDRLGDVGSPLRLYVLAHLEARYVFRSNLEEERYRLYCDYLEKVGNLLFEHLRMIDAENPPRAVRERMEKAHDELAILDRFPEKIDEAYGTQWAFSTVLAQSLLEWDTSRGDVDEQIEATEKAVRSIHAKEDRP